MVNLKNTIERFIRELNRDGLLSDEYNGLYEDYVQDDKLVIVFSSLHAFLTSKFECMNQRLPTGENGNHFWADPSRDLIKAIDYSDELIKSLQNTEYSCNYTDYYKTIIKKCKEFLSPSGGSLLPPHFDKVELYYAIPIFSFNNVVSIQNNPELSYPLKSIGSGSYANVSYYYDEFYQSYFAVKHAHKDLSAKEVERFKQEYETMRRLNSPYILKVYQYNSVKNFYIMEYMDCTIDKYISQNNDKLSKEQRRNIIFQIFRAFTYLHSNKILHRDISPKNILVKNYDDAIVIKVSDFGLVKIPDSQLTSDNTEIKGYFNDPSLVVDSFKNYTIEHETYALTRLVVYVLTGKTNCDKIKNEKLKNFVEKGLNADKSNRFKSVAEIKTAVIELFQFI